MKTEKFINFFLNPSLSKWGFVVAFLLLLFLVFRLLFKKFRKEKVKKSLSWALSENLIVRFFGRMILGVEKFLAKPIFSKTWFIILGFFLTFTAGVVFAAGVVVPAPKVIYPNSPSLGVTAVSNKEPFKIVFDRPIDKSIEKEISPDLPGNWVFKSSSYGLLPDTLIFNPQQTPAADTRYTISLKKIKSLTQNGNLDYLLSFATTPLPGVKSFDPPTGTEGILPGQEIKVEIESPANDLAKFDFALKPELPLEIKNEDSTRFSIKAKDGFKKSTSYTLEVYRTPTAKNYKTGEIKESGEKALVASSTFRTLEAPGVADYGPKGSGILVDAQPWLEFKQDMDQASMEKAFSITPNPGGSLSWTSNRKLIYKPNSLFKNTTYTINISTEAKAADSSPLEGAFSFSFTTIGPVIVSGFSPANNASNVNLGAKVAVTFNQAVDHASAESKFSISPIVSGSFSWSGNTMSYNHSGFSYATRYTVSIASGVKTVYGLDSIQGYSAAFTTQQQSVTLNVPSYHQSHMYSCMASAARQALAYRGAYVSEDTLLAQIGYDYTPFSGSWGDPNAVWGDPYSGVVGNINGQSGGVTWGYGAYWGPTSKAISNYRSNEVKTGWNVQGIAAEIAAGNPVIVWWVNGVWPAYEVYWKTPGGTPVRGVNSMHVQVVKGFTGTVDNPTSFFVNDSGYGYPSRTFDVNTFKAKWGWFGNSAIVVR